MADTMRRWRNLSMLAICLLLLHSCSAMRHGKGYGECVKNGFVGARKYPAQFFEIPIDHFHNESRYEPHLNGTFRNRYWLDATYYKPGGPVIVENKGESSYPDYEALVVGLLHELARATGGLAVLFEHRYYGSNPVDPVNHVSVGVAVVGLISRLSQKRLPVYASPVDRTYLSNIVQDRPRLTLSRQDFRFLSVEQALADQAYFAQNVVFSGLEQYDLTAPNTPWFAIGASYPGAFTAWSRVQYPDVYWGAIASSAVTALKDNYWEYMDTVRKYTPPDCAEVFGKMIDMADDILLGSNETAIKEFKRLWSGRFALGTNSSVGDFAYWNLNPPYGLQSKSWIPCLEQGELKGCRTLLWPTLLYPKVAHLRNAIKAIVNRSKWASESATLTMAWLNYIGWSNYYHEVNTTASTERQLVDSVGFYPGQKLKFPEDYLAWQYQQCTEVGLFVTGDNPTKDILPVYSRTQSLHYVKNMECRNQLYLNLTQVSVNPKLLEYGNFNISYNRLMFTGGEVDPWRPATQLATLDNEPSRLNYSSTLDQPWYLIPNASHAWDFFGVFPNQTEPNVPPEGIKRVHLLEKEALIRWTAEWHGLYPERSIGR